MILIYKFREVEIARCIREIVGGVNLADVIAFEVDYAFSHRVKRELAYGKLKLRTGEEVKLPFGVFGGYDDYYIEYSILEIRASSDNRLIACANGTTDENGVTHSIPLRISAGVYMPTVGMEIVGEIVRYIGSSL